MPKRSLGKKKRSTPVEDGSALATAASDLAAALTPSSGSPAAATSTPTVDMSEVFAAVLRRRNSRQPADIEANAVLTAVESVIDAQGMAKTPTAYYGALMYSLDEDPAASDQIVGAILYLLSLVLPTYV